MRVRVSVRVSVKVSVRVSMGARVDVRGGVVTSAVRRCTCEVRGPV